MDRVQENLERWCSGEGIQFKDEKAKELYRQRAKRIADVVQLKVPDRVPVTPMFSMFAAFNAGITCEEFIFEPDKAYRASKKLILDLEPDTGNFGAMSLSIFEAIKYKALQQILLAHTQGTYNGLY